MARTFIILIFFLFNSCCKSQVVINGAGQAVSINSGQSASITINKYFPPLSGDITFADDHFQFSIPGYAGIGFTARSTAAYVDFETPETNISVKIGGNWSTASSSIDAQSECQVLVNGAYNQSVTLTADNTTQTYAITLPAGEKTVRLVNGYTANAMAGSITLPNAGVYIQGVITTGDISIIRPPAVQSKRLFVGNSITTGAIADYPSVTGYLGLFRSESGWQAQADSWGARRLLTTTEALGEEFAAFLSSEMNGVSINELFMMLGTNNFGLSGGQSKAVFKLEYQYFLDELHALRPDIIIYCVSPLNRTGYSTPNSQGATLEDYDTAIQELIADGRSWAMYIYGKDLVSLVNMPDGLHPDEAGHQQMYENLLAAYNALQ